jgi:hypothetical protein
MLYGLNAACFSIYIYIYIKPSLGWQGTKEKFLRKSPYISLHYAGISLRSQLQIYQKNIRQDETITFEIVL